MKRISADELKANLEEYLRAVQAGERVVVCEHDRAVAELVRRDDSVTKSADDGDDIRMPTSRPFITRPTAPMPRLEELKPSAPLTDVDVVAVLRESRDQR